VASDELLLGAHDEPSEDFRISLFSPIGKRTLAALIRGKREGL